MSSHVSMVTLWTIRFPQSSTTVTGSIRKRIQLKLLLCLRRALLYTYLSLLNEEC